MYMLISLLICHRICSSIHRGSGKHDMKCPTSAQRDNSTTEPHGGRDVVSSLPVASVLAHAATFPGASALLPDPRTRNWNACVKEKQAVRPRYYTSQGDQRKPHFIWPTPGGDVKTGNRELNNGSLSRQYSELHWQLGLPTGIQMIK